MQIIDAFKSLALLDPDQAAIKNIVFLIAMRVAGMG